MLRCLAVIAVTAWAINAHAQTAQTEAPTENQRAVLELPLELPLELAPVALVNRLDEVAGALASAQVDAAALREGEALHHLAHARSLAESVLRLPGASRWLAEVELRTAVVAAQAGLDALSHAALRRAASLDPRRRLRAGEAPPEVVAHAAQAYDAMRLVPEGRFALEVVGMSTPVASEARVFLDDQPLGALPRVVSARVGPHVLRIEAPHHAAYAALIDVFEGERPAMAVALAPTGQAPTPAQTALALDQRNPGPPLNKPTQSAKAPAAPQASTPVWERWYVWSGAAVVVVATTLAIVLAAQPTPENQLNVRVQTGDVR